MKLFTITASSIFCSLALILILNVLKGTATKGMELFNGKIRTGTSVDGLMVSQMVKGNFFGKMEISTWEILRTVK